MCIRDRSLGWFLRLGVWSKARKPWVKSWTEATAPSWDAAVRGSSALQEAFRRVLDEEVCSALAIPYGH
eukprot:7178436-Pyramimonas_sp.AAC.1